MTSIRQRRRNRHKVKATQKQASKPLCLTLNIDVSGVNAAFAQAGNAMAKLSEAMAQPEFQEIMNKAWQELTRLVSLGISQLKLTDTGTLRSSFNFESARAMLFADQEAELLRQYELAHHQYQLGQLQEDAGDDCLGDPSCKFNARRQSPPQASPYIQCAVDTKGDCVNCKYFEA